MHIFASGAARTNAPGQEIGENTKKMEANRPRPCHLRVASRLRAFAHFPRTPENKGTKLAVCTLARNIASRLRASAHFPRTPENKGIKLAVCTLARNIASRLRASTYFPRTPGMQRNKISRLYPRPQHCKPLARLHTHFPRTPGIQRNKASLSRPCPACCKPLAL